MTDDTTQPAIPAWARIWSAFAGGVVWLWGVAARVYLHFTGPITFREVLLLTGSTLLGVGLYAVYAPAAYIAPGLVLTYVAIAGVK